MLGSMIDLIRGAFKKKSVKFGILSQRGGRGGGLNGDFVWILSQYGGGSPVPTKKNHIKNHQSPKKWDFFMKHNMLGIA